MKKTCFLKPDPRGCFVGEINEPWEIEGKVNIPAGARFVLWRLGTEERGPKLVELAAPNADITKKAILLLKVYFAENNRYYGKRRLDLRGPMAVTKDAKFNVFENSEDFGLTVS